MKRILSILSVATLFVLIGCTDSNDDMEIVYDSIIEPDFTVAAAEIVAGVTPVTFTNTKTIQPPNGIITTIAPYAIMVVLAAGAGVYFVYSRRRRNR